MTAVPMARDGAWSRLLRQRSTATAFSVLLLVLMTSLAAPWLPLPDPAETHLQQRLLGPMTSGHWLGTDQLGRDVLARLLFGARLSVAVAVVGVGVAAFSGCILGLISGYFRGRADEVLMRLVDVVMAFPYLLLALAIVAVLGPGLRNATFAIAIVNIPFFARTVRGQVLSLQRETFVDAARVGGLSDARILLSEILPAVVPMIGIAASTSIGWMILETAGLSFLGLGAQPPTADLGGMLGQGRHLLATAPHVSLVPGVFIFIVVALFNVVGDGLRDALDPRHTASRRDGGRAAGAKADTSQAPTGGEDVLLRVRGLSVAFGTHQVTSDVSFAVAAGERVALVGESGSGKSVTSRAVLNLLDASGCIAAGSITFDGLPLVNAPAKTWAAIRGGRIAWIPQDPMTSLHPFRRVEQQLGEALRLHRGLGVESRKPAALLLLREVGIQDPEARLRAYPHQLSGGMRQRVVIAMALAGEPDLLIADEPTTALDVTTQASVLTQLDALCRRRSAALLFISHDLAVVSQICDRVLVMRRGTIVEEGRTTQIIEAPQHAYTKRLLASVPKLGEPGIIIGRGDAANVEQH